MTTDEDRAFIWQCAEAFMALGPHLAPAREPAWDARADGVPPDLAMTEPDEDGMVQWKFMRSSVSDTEIAAATSRLSGPLPPLFVAYLATLYAPRLQIGAVVLPHLPPDNPLGEFQEVCSRWSRLMESGFVPFSESERGPLCFDTRHRDRLGDCLVVLLDADLLHDLGADQWDQRDLVASAVTVLAHSFRALMVDLFLKRAPRGSAEA